jgi:hypothetical protein
MGIALDGFSNDAVSLGPGYAFVLPAQAALDFVLHGDAVKRLLVHGLTTSQGLKMRIDP